MNKRTTSSYQFDPFHLDVTERLLWREGKPVPLTQKAFEILLMLVERNGHLVEKEELMKAVWADTFVEEANLSQNIFQLRKALGKTDGGQQYIETVPRRGYRFIAPVSEVRDKRADAADKPARAARSGKRNARARDKAINSLAVLPLVNESSDKNAEYLSDGITESIINILSQLPQLRVMAHSAVLRYKGREVDPQEVGRELGVSAVLIGRVMQLGDRLVIRTELVDVANGWQLWGEQYDRPPSDILEVQEEIARNISDKLKLKLTLDEKKRLARRSTENSEAYHLYLRGRYFWNTYHGEAIIKGIEYFHQAIDIDPNYALAYAGLADSYHRLSSHHLSPREAMAKAKATALKAVESDDNLAEAHISLGLVKLFYDRDLPGAEREYRRAIELNPGAPLAHLRYGAYLTYMQRFTESEVELKLALELDPLSLQGNVSLGTTWYLMGRYEEAIKQYQKSIELDPNYFPAYFGIGLVYVRQKRYEEAIATQRQVCRLSKDVYLPLGFVGHAYAVSGQRSEAEKIIKELEEAAQRTYVSPYSFAIVYAGLGEKDLALEWLEKTYEEGSDWLLWLKVAQEFDDLRSDKRFIALLKRVGFIK
jgi:TolB-like protein/Tfp pilus assembly protein PilF